MRSGFFYLFGFDLAERVFADVEPFPGGCVHGAVYEVGEGEIEGLDHYEGFPEEYGKINVQVVDEQGKSWEAFLYVMTPRYRGECESYPYSNCYRSECSQGARDWGIPDAFAAEADPNR